MLARFITLEVITSGRIAATHTGGTVTIDYGVESVLVDLGDGSDRVGVRAIDVPHTIRTGGGDDIVAIGANHPLRFAEEASSGGLKPYVTVRGRLEARLTRALYFDLVELAAESDDGEGLVIWSGGQAFPLRSGAACQAGDGAP